ncbi:MAG: hypothetical protein RLY86_1769 [Pseudomonadota bacterium]
MQTGVKDGADTMAEIINLNRARKARQRQDKAKQAASNRAKHGLTKAERQAQVMEAAKRARLVDGHRLEQGRDGKETEGD